MSDGLVGDSHQRHFSRSGRLVCGVATRRGWRLPVLVLFGLGMLLLQAAPAGAVEASIVARVSVVIQYVFTIVH